ncbi:hypothetical protein LCGC14_3079800 [marine sediment metagenome]|uniref:Uncharacterized protein n=1 Tax=marine sediment metagenome TaxID=412755 RepID=A0A0F8WDM9_9ZZZZ
MLDKLTPEKRKHIDREWQNLKWEQFGCVSLERAQEFFLDMLPLECRATDEEMVEHVKKHFYNFDAKEWEN